jgi:hypothetical protein
VGWVRWAIVVLALCPGLWMSFDGGRALIVGDYVTPRSGEYFGRLGPWAGVVRAAGLEPRSGAVKSVILALGALWLVAAAAVAFGVPRAEVGVLVLAVATLWYLPIGTAVSILQIVLSIAWLRFGPGR